MIPRRQRLDHRRLSFGVEACQENGRLHLSRGHGQLEVDRLESATTLDDERSMTVERLHTRAHAPKGLRHALHRTARERLVANELEPSLLPGDEPGQEPHQRSGVPAVDGGSGLDETAQADTVHRHRVDIVLLHLDSESPDGGDGGLGVGRPAESADPRLALAQRADEHGSVRDGLVARHRDVPDEGGDGLERTQLAS